MNFITFCHFGLTFLNMTPFIRCPEGFIEKNSLEQVSANVLLPEVTHEVRIFIDLFIMCKCVACA